MKKLLPLLVLVALVLIPMQTNVSNTPSGLPTISLAPSMANATWIDRELVELIDNFCDAHPSFPGCDGCAWC